MGSVQENNQQDRVVRKEHCAFCFETLIRHLDGLDANEDINFDGNPKYCLFVTWRKRQDESLRGCVGTFEPKALRKGLAKYAIVSAQEDNRFNPISKREIKDLQVTVSLLTNFQPRDNIMDWEIGKHGIRIEFPNERGQLIFATYLPEVMTDMGWNKLETIDSLMRKGGYRGQITQEIRNSIKLTTYESQKEYLTYDEYLLHSNQ